MKTERLTIEGKSNFYPCDLCDKVNFPLISWHCTHDDPAHVTNICWKCLKELGSHEVVVKANEDDFEAKRTDPFQKTF